MWITNITKHNYVIEFYNSNMTYLQSLGNSFSKFGLVWPESSTFWKEFHKDSGTAGVWLFQRVYIAEKVLFYANKD